MNADDALTTEFNTATKIKRNQWLRIDALGLAYPTHEGDRHAVGMAIADSDERGRVKAAWQAVCSKCGDIMDEVQAHFEETQRLIAGQDEITLTFHAPDRMDVEKVKIVPPGSVDYESLKPVIVPGCILKGCNKFDDPRHLGTDDTGKKCPRCLRGHICGTLFTVCGMAVCDYCGQRFLLVEPEGYRFELIPPDASKCRREHQTDNGPVRCGQEAGHVGDCSGGPQKRLAISAAYVEDITRAMRNAACTCGVKHVGGEHSTWCDSRTAP